MDNEKLKSETDFLFNRDWEEDLPDEEAEAVDDRAANLIALYGWQRVFEAWNDYLHTKCTTPEAVINFASLYWRYLGEQHPIPEPHKFLAYMLYKINCKMYDYENGDVIESLATNILPKAGYSEADLYLHPYYAVDQDPKILAEVEALRKQHA